MVRAAARLALFSARVFFRAADLLRFLASVFADGLFSLSSDVPPLPATHIESPMPAG